MMYGCGLRMSEALNIRVKDIDFGFYEKYEKQVRENMLMEYFSIQLFTKYN